MLNSSVLNGRVIRGGSSIQLGVRLSGRFASVQPGTLDGGQELGGRSSCRITLVNPGVPPVEGETFEVRLWHELLFAGTLHEITQETNPTLTRNLYRCEALGWEHLLERHVMTATYESQKTGVILDDVVARHLVADGILRGTFDPGVTITLAKGDEIRVSEFMRDVVDAAGGFIVIDPGKVLSFYAQTLPAAPFTLTHATVEQVGKTLDREDYRNKMTVRVRGMGGATVDVTRSDASQIAQRQAVEGGSGLYERFEAIEHPTSNDPVQLTRLGIGYALTKLFLAGQSKLSLLARTRLPHLRVGQLLTVNLPAYGLSGTWTITRLRFWEEDGQHLLYEIEAALSSVANLALESLLRIVQAGRATVQLPAAEFANLQTFTASGTFVVPGTGSVELQLVTYGAGAGGSSGGFTPLGAKFSGQPGGNGGKATTFRAFPAGTLLTITVGSGGVGGNPMPGGARGPGESGGLSKVESNGLLAQGDGGIGDTTTHHGGGQGDFVIVGGGAAGGAPGPDSDPQTGGDGQDGRVEIFY